MNVEISGDDGNGMLRTGSLIRGQLIQYMADSLRDLPGEKRIFLHLPRVLVSTEWSQWMQDAEPTTHGNDLAFRVLYAFFPGGGWDTAKVCAQLEQLWRTWGWTCTPGTPPVGGGHTLVGRSDDGYEFTMHAASDRCSSSLEIASPPFHADADRAATTMPFAVTPFGELALPQIWATYPELVTW